MDGVGVTADGLGLRGPRGWAFRGVGFRAEPGSLIVIEGPSGSGRTSLLLALTGRMKATEGTATVGTARLPKQAAAARKVSALAHVAGLTDLEPALTVGEHLRERALLERRFSGSVRQLLRPRAEKAAELDARVDDALAAAGLDLESLPKGARTAVRDLERLEALRLSVALALVGRPGLLGVDDADLKLSEGERADVRALFASLTAAGTTVVAVCGEAPEDAVRVTTSDQDGEAGATDLTGAAGATGAGNPEPAAAPEAEGDTDAAEDGQGKDGKAGEDGEAPGNAAEAADAADTDTDTGATEATAGDTPAGARDDAPKTDDPKTDPKTDDRNTGYKEDPADALPETGRA
ncbi:ATP-binding cassette domain-containing protein [Streptomyces sp. NPDC002566]|uniref:ATP-binding cassette domain-containing protein n=1 Tax=Streptomyces sp. NPDC002566 TaxID=3364650 RepID=UPI00368ACC73